MMRTMGYYLNRTHQVLITVNRTASELYTKQDTGLWQREFLSSTFVRCRACGMYAKTDKNDKLMVLNFHDDSCKCCMMTNEELCIRLNEAFEKRQIINFMPQ